MRTPWIMGNNEDFLCLDLDLALSLADFRLLDLIKAVSFDL